MKALLKHVIMLLKLQFGRFGKLLGRICSALIFTVSLGALVLLAFSIGFDLNDTTKTQFYACCRLILVFFFVIHAIRMALRIKTFFKEKGAVIELLLFVLLLFTLFCADSVCGSSIALSWLRPDILVYVMTAVLSMIEVSKGMFGVMQQALNPSLLFAYSFLFFIMLGTALLMLPNCSVQAGSIRFLDALFTSASAVCITGLGVLDVSSDLTLTGQIILLCLAQVGAIGVMTFTSFFAMSFMGGASFHNQMMLKDLLVEDRLGAIIKTLYRILIVTFVAEVCGAVCIFCTLHRTLPLGLHQEIWYSFFHSVSAFCNSGISLFPDNLQQEVVRYNHMFQTCVALLVVLGGIGFPILFNYGKLLRHAFLNSLRRLFGMQRRYVHERILTVNTRLAIATSFWLIIGGWALFFLLENHHVLQGLPLPEKLATAFFCTVSPRSAGFNVMPVVSLASPTILLTMFLMWVGASPMSCGGGIKTTTLAVAVLSVLSVARGQRRIEICAREIENNTIRRAFSVIMLSVVLIFVVTGLLAAFEPRLNLQTVLFDAVSVLSTAGLSLHATTDFCDASKIVLIASMFVGRVGAVTLLTGCMRKRSSKMYTYPTEPVMVG